MAKRSVGKPKFYADYPSYLKAIGYYKGTYSEGFKDSVTDKDIESLFNMNPAQPVSLELESNLFPPFFQDDFKIGIKFQEDDEDPNKELIELLKTTNYAGLIGHNLMSMANNNADSSVVHMEMGFSNTIEDLTESNKLVNFQNVEYNGYSLWETGGFTSDDNAYKNAFLNVSYYSADAVQEFTAKLGSFTFGRVFEPEFAFDLQATLSTSYEGVKSQTSVGGSTLTNIQHTGQPSWSENLPAWTLEKQKGHDYKVGGSMGRRSWKVSLSFMADDNVFSKAGNENKFFTWTDQTDGTSGEPEYTFDSSLSSFFKLTLNGKLPFIFCPDSSATDLEFALCRISNQPTFKQVANNMFSTSLTLVETY